jgi:glycogen operon protein
MTMEIWRGAPYPLGAHWDGGGVNFALFSENATAVELCLFDADGGEQRIRIPERTDQVWHAYLPGIGPGQRYGYRVHGRWDPGAGHRFNPAKLLLDPYARGVDRPIDGDPLLTGHRMADDSTLQPDERDSAPAMARGVVLDPGFDWEGDRPLARPWEETLIYEMHVRGFTRQHPDVDPGLRGTYGGLASDAAIGYLRDLGVTAVELMPVHHHVDERQLVERGLTNYWGYNTIGFFAPDSRFAATDDPVREFKGMVKALHRAGIEVILDVVYNHTGEGNGDGPTLSFRGIDNAAYYRLDPDDLSRYVDYTGTGNTLNAVHPATLQLIMDSLRYWIADVHVDGFRFDLASALARELHDVDRLGSFFDIVHQDPMISQVKLIAEPWDVGPGGYQVGNFPGGWAEWNGKYRDTVRRFWKGSGGQAAELGYRLTGSSDLYAQGGRQPHASINFITAHDGFTMADLVSYEQKHNEANGEDNRDGESNNESLNFGVEGPSDDPAIRAARARQQRNLLATLLLSQGVPMLLGGDEIGRSQQGNNNAYCQDNAISWFDWDLTDDGHQLLDYTRGLIRLFHAHPVLRRRRFFQGRRIRGSRVKDLTWLAPDGTEMTDEEWNAAGVHAIGLRLAGDAIDERGPHGERIVDDTLLLLMNSGASNVAFNLPSAPRGWQLILDTRRGEAPDPEGGPLHEGGSAYRLSERSLALFRLVRRR